MSGARRRYVTALAALALGAGLALLPFVPWFAADAPGGAVTARGLSASGALWAVVVLGAVSYTHLTLPTKRIV